MRKTRPVFTRVDRIPLPQGDYCQLFGDAQDYLRQDLPEGRKCPCCGQYAKVYRRKFNSSMARLLLAVAGYSKANCNNWFHAPSCPKLGFLRNGDMGMLVHWGLVEAKIDIKDDGNPATGWHRVTPLGIQFAAKAARIPQYIFLYNDQVLERGGDEIDVVEALGNRFNYYDIMSDSSEP